MDEKEEKIIDIPEDLGTVLEMGINKKVKQDNRYKYKAACDKGDF